MTSSKRCSWPMKPVPLQQHLRRSGRSAASRSHSDDGPAPACHRGSIYAGGERWLWQNKQVPGISEALRAASLAITPRAMLSAV